MHVLCDTCIVLMLLRIAPSMFTDAQFGCFTIGSVRREFVQTQRFKGKYPWRKEYAQYITFIPKSHTKHEDVELYYEAIRVKTEHGVINKLNDKLFDLGRTDQRLIAWSLGLGLPISTGDKDIIAFAQQEFEGVFKRYVSPLAILNGWIRDGLVLWTDTLNTYLEDWKKNNEPAQPKGQKQKFRQLTEHKYPGP